MSRASRLHRLEELLLGTSKGYTLRELADKLDVHRTTIWRDLNELTREAPVQQEGHRYLIDHKEYISSIRLTSGEALMLYLALRRLLRERSHLPPMMLMALEKLSLAMKDPSAAQLMDLLQSLKDEMPSNPERAKIWETLIQAWMERIMVRVAYQELGHSVVDELEIEPYLFEPAVLSGGIYLVGRSLKHDALKILRVEHILKATLTTKRFERPDNILIDDMLRRYWAIWYGEELTEVRLRFREPAVVRRVRKTVWLPSQKVIDLPGGGIEWIVQVPDVFELVPWIRGWGPDCEVVSPPELQEQIEKAEYEFGGVTMATADVPRTRSFSDQFYASVQEITEGERIKTCLQCSSCSGICPLGYWMEYHPRLMITALRAGEFDPVMESDSVWMCVSCYACTEVCPAKIPVTEGLMTRTKEEMLLAGNVPRELQDALENSQRYGNPLGESPRKRANWAKGIQPEISLMAKAKRPVDVLWFVGDYPSYHPRSQVSARAFAQILRALGIDFGILGPEENSDGDSQRLAGERGLFEMMAEKNGKAFGKYEFNEIVTTDPHAYNAIKNEYPALGINYPVKHYTQFLAERLDALSPLLTASVNATVTFHDPCYLGRVNSVFDAPRELLKAIPGVQLVEMTHNRENSLCCGGGGGGMWLDGFTWEKTNSRLSEWRVREAVNASGADVDVIRPPGQKKRGRKAQQVEDEPEEARILAVACPYEAPRFEDATKMVADASQLVVMDVAELLVEAMAA
jgi:Fe-S oxidoreductase/predicted DNA-binding transcriptional regulator YafY